MRGTAAGPAGRPDPGRGPGRPASAGTMAAGANLQGRSTVRLSVGARMTGPAGAPPPPRRPRPTPLPRPPAPHPPRPLDVARDRGPRRLGPAERLLAAKALDQLD